MLWFEHRAQNQQGLCFVFESKTTCDKTKKFSVGTQTTRLYIEMDIFPHCELG